jgi:hypothetical protein
VFLEAFRDEDVRCSLLDDEHTLYLGTFVLTNHAFEGRGKDFNKHKMKSAQDFSAKLKLRAKAFRFVLITAALLWLIVLLVCRYMRR